MSTGTAKYPVFVSRAKEIEQMAYFTADLQYRLECRGIHSGVKYECLRKVRTMCTELLLRIYAEDSEIVLMDETDSWWVRKIVWFVHNVILKDQQKTG